MKQFTPHDKKALQRLLIVLVILILTIVASFYTGQSIFIVAYILIIVGIIYRLRRENRPWIELGIKGDFAKDLKHVLFYSLTDAFVFQIIPPMLLISLIFGYWGEVVQHIKSRISTVISIGDPITIAIFLILTLILTLIEELVFRVSIQEQLSWFIGTPLAILISSLLFCSVHAIGTFGSPIVILFDVGGVAIDGFFLGIIYAKTHNLALTWATHYVADVVGFFALFLIFS